LIALPLDVDLFSVARGCAIDAGVMNTGKHQHLIIGFIAQIAHLAHIHFDCIWFNINNKNCKYITFAYWSTICALL